jgi:hypothetical protein
MGHISYLSIVLPLLPEEQLGVNNMRLWKEKPDPSSVGAFTPHFLYRQELIGARRHYVRVWTLLDSAMRLPKRCVRQC